MKEVRQRMTKEKVKCILKFFNICMSFEKKTSKLQSETNTKAMFSK